MCINSHIPVLSSCFFFFSFFCHHPALLTAADDSLGFARHQSSLRTCRCSFLKKIAPLTPFCPASLFFGRGARVRARAMGHGNIHTKKTHTRTRARDCSGSKVAGVMFTFYLHTMDWIKQMHTSSLVGSIVSDWWRLLKNKQSKKTNKKTEN